MREHQLIELIAARFQCDCLAISSCLKSGFATASKTASRSPLGLNLRTADTAEGPSPKYTFPWLSHCICPKIVPNSDFAVMICVETSCLPPGPAVFAFASRFDWPKADNAKQKEHRKTADLLVIVSPSLRKIASSNIRVRKLTPHFISPLWPQRVFNYGSFDFVPGPGPLPTPEHRRCKPQHG